MTRLPAILLAFGLLAAPVLSSLPAHAAAQSDCQTEACKKAQTNREENCHHNSPPVSFLPARLQADRHHFA